MKRLGNILLVGENRKFSVFFISGINLYYPSTLSGCGKAIIETGSQEERRYLEEFFEKSGFKIYRLNLEYPKRRTRLYYTSFSSGLLMRTILHRTFYYNSSFSVEIDTTKTSECIKFLNTLKTLSRDFRYKTEWRSLCETRLIL